MRGFRITKIKGFIKRQIGVIHKPSDHKIQLEGTHNNCSNWNYRVMMILHRHQDHVANLIHILFDRYWTVR